MSFFLRYLIKSYSINNERPKQEAGRKVPKVKGRVPAVRNRSDYNLQRGEVL